MTAKPQRDLSGPHRNSGAGTALQSCLSWTEGARFFTLQYPSGHWILAVLGRCDLGQGAQLEAGVGWRGRNKSFSPEGGSGQHRTAVMTIRILQSYPSV